MTKWKTVCPRCKREGPLEWAEPQTMNCGDCLFEDTEVVALEVKPITESLGWIIVSTDSSGLTQFWCDGYGWVDERHNAATYSDEEKASYVLPIGGSWQRFEEISSWFIVVGRMWGDDEATAMKLLAKSSSDADEAYRKEMRSNAGFADGEEEPEDGPGRVFVDQVFDCGDHQPREVQ